MSFQFQPFITNHVTVIATPTLIADKNPDRKSITITQLGTNDVYIGDSVVTTNTGDLLVGTKGTKVTYFATTNAIYGVSGSEQAVSYFEIQ